MGNSNSATQQATIKAPEVKDVATGEKPKCKACCACPETKKVRDEW